MRLRVQVTLDFYKIDNPPEGHEVWIKAFRRCPWPSLPQQGGELMAGGNTLIVDHVQFYVDGWVNVVLYPEDPTTDPRSDGFTPEK